MELGGRWSDATGLVSSTNSTSWFFYTGYRTAF
jgi:hypothetical protein